MKPNEVLNLMKLGLDETPYEDKTGIGFAIGQLHNIFKKAGEKYEIQMKPTQTYPPIPVTISRDFEGCSEIELALEVAAYTPAIPQRSFGHGCIEGEPGHVEFGDAHTLDGREFILTPLERECVEAQAIKQLFP